MDEANSKNESKTKREHKLTGKSDGAVHGEDTGFAAVVTELAVRVTRDDLATVAAEELDGGGDGGREGRRVRLPDHAWLERER